MVSLRIHVATCLFLVVLLSTNELLQNPTTFYNDFAQEELILSSPKSRREYSRCDADTFLRDAYEKTYKPLVTHCRLGNTSLFACIERELLNSNQTLPWWQLNMYHLIIARKTGIEGSWHELWFADPPLKFCSLEKVGTTQWRAINYEAHNKTKRFGWKQTNIEASPYAVFLRDPLERFLSGYLNKCKNSPKEGHCEPNEIFAQSQLTASLRNRQHFEAFIATMPLSWNLHFHPQALYCGGLFRNINNYEFVGSMDTALFPRDLARFREQYRGHLADLVQAVFPFDSNESDYRETLATEKRLGHASNAPQHVQEYYSADSIRKVLEYLSIDYVTLNLTVPNWAREKLLADCELESMA